MAETDFGKYKLIAELGHGGMADVFLAVQGGFSGSGFRKLMVVKRLRKNLAFEPEFVAMLVDEARIAARLSHPNVVQTNEVGEFQGQYFIAMEYLDGQSLHMIQHRNAQLAKQGQPTSFGPDLQCVVILDVLAGLHHAHELIDYDGKALEIVHRDVTPHNIFVTYDGQVKVVDFGIAKASRRASETRQGILKGKVRYMAPEQTLGKNVDRRADVFAAGIMLWEIASGAKMWADKDDLEIVQALVTGEMPRSPRAINPEVPEALDAIIVKALAQKPADRYATAEEFRDELEQYLIDTNTLSAARRKLPAALDQLFKDKRVEIRAIIEKQLQALEEVPSADFAAIEIPQSNPSFANGRSGEHGTRASAGNDEDFEGDDDEVDVEGEGDGRDQEEPQQASGSVRMAFVLAIVATVVLVVCALVIGLRGTGKTAAVPAESEVNVRINATPATAKVSLDDGPLGPVPFGGTMKKDGRQHRVHVEAPGYQPQNDLVVMSQDVLLSFNLLKADAPPTTGPSTEPATPPASAEGVGALALRPAGGGKPRPNPAHEPSPATSPAPAPPTAVAVPPTTVAPPPTPPPVTAQPPAAPVGPSPAEVAADYRKAVYSTIRGHSGDVQACYDRAKVASPHLAGAVAVGASLSPAGGVTTARVANSTVRTESGNGATLLEQCLVERFKTWAFPPVPAGASSEISYNFKFE